jgi:hypothetical protein
LVCYVSAAAATTKATTHHHLTIITPTITAITNRVSGLKNGPLFNSARPR